MFWLHQFCCSRQISRCGMWAAAPDQEWPAAPSAGRRARATGPPGKRLTIKLLALPEPPTLP